MKRLIRWLKRLPYSPLNTKPPVVAISENNDVLCEACHHHVAISGFIPHLSGAANECPRCGCVDQTKLKYVAAWMRTEDEQTAHWGTRKVRTGFVRAINGGVPLPLPKRPEPSKDAA